MLTLALAACWLAFGPATPDLAAQVHRVGVFTAYGFTIWDNAWYGGHPLPDYSLVFPMVGSVLGARLVAASAAVGSAALFEALVARDGQRHPFASWWFATGCIADLLIGRLTYALGVTAGLAALLALTRGRHLAGSVLAAVCAATSPVAGLFLVLAGTGYALTGRSRYGLLVAGAAGSVVVALGVAFPEGGTQPFSLGAFAVTTAITLGAAVVAGPERSVRLALLLYVGATIACFVVASPMGSNVTRLGTAFVAPGVLATTSPPRSRRAVLVAILVAAAAWEWADPLVQVAHGWNDPSSGPAYYAAVIAELDRLGAGQGRLEVPFTRGHWETVYLARRFALARGWERQLDRRLNPLFYETHLAPGAYDRWLRANAVHYVALPDVPMDTAGRAEAAIVVAQPTFLQRVWHDAHWSVFKVRGALPLASGPVRGLRLGASGLRMTVTRPGTVLARVRWTPYWRIVVGSGCVTREGSWTLVRAWRPGVLALAARFSMHRLLDAADRCPARGPALPGRAGSSP